MSDAELAKLGRHTASIDESLKQLVRIMSAFNENLVSFYKKLEDWDTEMSSEDQQGDKK
jgi:hypothetical protein